MTTTITDAEVEAAAEAIHAQTFRRTLVWDTSSPKMKQEYLDRARAALTAAAQVREEAATEEFAHLEQCIKNPKEPSPLIHQGAALLAQLRAQPPGAAMTNAQTARICREAAATNPAICQ